MAVPQQLEELLDGGDGGVRVRPHRHDLPQEHAERPHVRLRRVPPLEERLRGHPLDGQPATRRVNFDESVFRMLLKTVLKTGFLVKISYLFSSCQWACLDKSDISTDMKKIGKRF